MVRGIATWGMQGPEPTLLRTRFVIHPTLGRNAALGGGGAYCMQVKNNLLIFSQHILQDLFKTYLYMQVCLITVA